MIGEIRDTETLEISFKAAQTGHLVLSTLHAKNPFQTFERLETMSESLFNVVNSISLICSQRLFRKLCKNCRIPQPVTVGMEKEMKEQGINLKAGDVSYKANQNGCDECHDGHSGRTAIFEVLKMDDDIKEMLLKREPSSKIKEVAKRKGYKEMKDVALTRLKNGEISLEEFFANI
jgi:type IV pilus assembly protein PilB